VVVKEVSVDEGGTALAAMVARRIVSVFSL
jgi:hypothetical protein